MDNLAGFSLRLLDLESCLCCLAEQWTASGQETSMRQAEKMVSENRGAGASGGE